MNCKIVKDLTIKTGEGKRLLQAGQVIRLPKDKAVPLVQAGLITPVETSTPPALDTDLLNISATNWLERLSDDERDIFHERSALMEYSGGLPREQAEVEAIQRIIQERIVPKCGICKKISGCMMTRGQRVLCEVIKL